MKGKSAKQPKLTWRSKCVQAAGVEVKFPEEGSGGGCEEDESGFWITAKIGDQVYKAVWDTCAALSIMARRFLKKAKVRTTKTVAIRVGDGRTIYFLGVGRFYPVSGR